MLTIGSLFSGIGGLELGLEIAGLGPVRWQCESDPYCRAVLMRRWPGVPLYKDVRELSGAEPVDLICGGFPCQDVSQAGKREGIDGKRSGLWREFARIIRELGPGIVFVENVPGLLVRGFGTVLGDLADLGFDAEWTCLRAADCGAPHLRRRVFILATHRDLSNAQRSALRIESRGIDGTYGSGSLELGSDGDARHVAHANSGGCKGGRLAKPRGQQGPRWGEPQRCSEFRKQHDAAQGGHWQIEPAMGRVANGIPRRVDRLRALGNACVPQQVALAWELLRARAA